MAGLQGGVEQISKPQRKPFRFDADFMTQPSMVCSGEIHLPLSQKPKNGYPVAIVVPGYFANHTSDLSVSISTHLAQKGIVSVATDWDQEIYTDPIGNKNTLETIFEDGLVHNRLGLDSLIDKSQVFIVGISYGGTVAILSKLSQKVRGIIALSPPLDPTRMVQRPHFKQFSQAAVGSDGLLLGARKVFVPQSAYYFGGRTQQLNRSAEEMDRWLRESYQETRCPVVLINANEDKEDIVPLAEVEDMSLSLPNSKVITFPKPAGYNPNQVHNFIGELRDPLLNTLTTEIEHILS